MEIKRGDIFYADLSPVVGSEQGGVRPVLIIQNNRGNRHSSTVLVAAITSKVGKADIPTHVFLEKEWKGMRKDSVVMLEQIRTLDRSRFKEYIGSVDPGTMEQVNQAIVVSMDLESYMKTCHEKAMMLEKTEKKNAWIYCAIDDPEDVYGTLKKQYRKLEIYAESMGFSVIGRSSDVGGSPLWDRLGFKQFIRCAKAGESEDFTDNQSELCVQISAGYGNIAGGISKSESGDLQSVGRTVAKVWKGFQILSLNVCHIFRNIC